MTNSNHHNTRILTLGPETNETGGYFDKDIYVSKHMACIDEIMAILSEMGKPTKNSSKECT